MLYSSANVLYPSCYCSLLPSNTDISIPWGSISAVPGPWWAQWSIK